MNSNQATLQKLEMMGLWGMMRALRESMEGSSKADFTPDELISRLVDVEWDQRQGRKLSRLLKGARFRQDLILTGPCGCGKSFIASLLGQQACIHGHSVCYWPAGKLFEQMKLCKADGTYLRELAKITKKRLFIVDDFGLEVLDAASRLILLEILEDRHGRSSSLFSSQLPVSQWHQAIGDPTLADAICDRIVHTAHRIQLKGESVRKLYAHRGGEGKKEKE